MRHVIIHYHIFKNAGSTFVSTLERNFGPLFASWDGNEFDRQISGPELVSFLNQHTHILAMTSHHLRPPAPVADFFTFHDVLFLRHPVDRLRSMYDFYRSALPNDDPLTLEAKHRDCRAFFELLGQEYPHLVTNSQVNYVANRGNKIPDPADCERACAAVRNFAIVGATDQFTLCMVTAEHRLRPFFPGLDLSYVSENVTRGRHRRLRHRLQRFEKQCGEGVYSSLLELNQLDFKLTDAAREEAQARFRQVPRSDIAFKEFENRIKKRKSGPRMFPPAVDHPGDFSFYSGVTDLD